MAAINELLALIPAPASPVAAQGDWTQLQERLGLSLPSDYHGLVTQYGMGLFGDIFVMSPFAQQPHMNMASRNLDMAAHDPGLRQRYLDQFPYPMYPETGGLCNGPAQATGISCFG